jgi:ABC-type antimicrobial peptide transport system permease subunit
VRTALGAHPKSIVYTIARRATLQLGLGVVLGAVFAAYILAVIAQFPEMRPQNMPLVVVAVAAGTVLVGMLACLVPTLRGLRIQPTEALREG